MSGAEPMHCVACSIFRREIERLLASGALALQVDYLPSMLHMDPERLEARLRSALAGAGDVVLAFGDCCGHMDEFHARPGSSRTDGINCCEIILGRDTYRRLRGEGAFFLMPEWALGWRAIFTGELGLLGSNARTFMQEMHSRLIYLDTGIIPVPLEALAEAGEYLGLPVQVLPVSLEPLLAGLLEAVRSVSDHGQA